MKIEKKHIIIAIVVAVAVYLLYKRGVFGKKEGAEGSNASVTIDPVEDVIAESGMYNSEAKEVRSNIKKIKADEAWNEKVEEQADQLGRTYEQNLVINAYWTLYYNSEGNLKDENISDNLKNHIYKEMQTLKDL